jgi:hypothetical protein
VTREAHAVHSSFVFVLLPVQLVGSFTGGGSLSFFFVHAYDAAAVFHSCSSSSSSSSGTQPQSHQVRAVRESESRGVGSSA